MRMIVLRELRKAGYDSNEMIEADNGVAALDRIKESQIDLVVSDWNMPDMTGIELLAELRREGIKVPFGFVTSESAGEIRRRALDAGADFIVTKPFTGDDLCRAVEEALGGSGNGTTAGGSAELTVASVLAGLLDRDVVTADSEPPQKSVSRAVATYVTNPGGKTVYCVAEMAAAVAMGAALSRIPGSQAEEWSTARALPDAIQQNLHEVANVLAKVAIPADSGERSVLQEVVIIPDLDEVPGVGKVSDDRWRLCQELRISGYPTGRLGFIEA
jgi:two-component system chemotaxis response regulator CheY